MPSLRSTGLLTAILLASTSAAAGQDRVPFVIPDAPAKGVPIAMTGTPIPPDAEHVAVRDGHFSVDGKRLKIWGVNLCFGACFPERQDAETIARRLAAVGVNSVRFHHMDSQPWPRGILERNDRTKLVPEALERLDRFLDRLAGQGIRANLNLHVGRSASRALGLPDPGTKYDKIVGIFTPALIEAQKQYARDLLTHVNPHRGLRYADDPAVAFVEVTNEDSLFMWSAARDLRALPEYYAGILRERFNAWLKARYGSTEALRRAWAEGAEPLGENLLADSGFAMPKGTEKDAQRWVLEQHGGCRMKAVPLESRQGVRLAIDKADDTSWHLQVKQVPLTVKGGRYCTLTFRARADKPRTVSYSLSQDHEPWGNLGLAGRADLTTEWKRVTIGFTVKADSKQARLSFALGGSTVSVELADIRLRPGGRTGLAEGESLEEGNVAVFAPAEVEARAMDRWRFLGETEKAYFDELRRFIKEDLGVKALVTGTIVYGALGLYGQSDMDFIDSHAYWQHPRFPGRPWDPNNWTIGQNAMTDHPEQATLWRLASERLAGKPHTVSEYNHPAPSDFQAECVPMLASFAAAQDWDGIWLFTYGNRSESMDQDRFRSYFDIHMNPAKWGFMRTGAEIFLRGGAGPLAKARCVALADPGATFLDGLIALHRKHDRDLFAAVAERAGITWKDLLGERLAVALSGQTQTFSPPAERPPSLRWEDAKGRSTFVVTADGARVFIGHQGARGAGVELRRPEFAAVTVTPLDSLPLDRSRAIFIAACGRCENTGMRFSEDRRTVGRNWGEAPVRIEPVEADVELPHGAYRYRWKCHALKPDGTRGSEVPVDLMASLVKRVRLDPKYATMWYLLERSE